MTTPTAHRTLHVIDLENLVGGTDASPGDLRAAWDAYRGHGIGIADDDHVIIATSSHVARVAWFALPATGIQRLVRDGQDGADLALIDAVDVPHAATRYGRISLASGDHAFTQLVLEAKSHRMRVQLVIGRGQPSRELMAACTARTWLRLDPTVGLAAYRAGRFRRDGHGLAA